MRAFVLGLGFTRSMQVREQLWGIVSHDRDGMSGAYMLALR